MPAHLNEGAKQLPTELFDLPGGLVSEIDRTQKRRRLRALIIGGCGLAVVGLSMLISVYVSHRSSDVTLSALRSPVGREAGGAIVIGGTGARVPRVEIFEDFGCLACKEFEKSGGNVIRRLAAAGKINVWYEPIWLSRNQPEPMRGNSQRAANAALCGPVHKWLDYHDKIYKNQPAEGARGFSNEELIGWGRELGFATPSFEQCVIGMQRQQQLNQVTDYARDVRKLAGAPTIFLNGKSLYRSEAIFDPEKLEKVLMAGGSPN